MHMTVKELMALLSNAKPDAIVSIYDYKLFLVSRIESVDIEDDENVTLVTHLEG